MAPDDKLAEDVEIKQYDALSGRYQLLGKLGQGGFGTIYKATQLSTGRTVAIKFLKDDDLADKDLVRFKREAAALSVLSHPNIVAIVDFGHDENRRPYLVLDFVEGLTLESLLKERKQLDGDEFKDVFIQICKGLSHAHSRGIIHRDLKPSNIMIVNDASGERIIKIVDFGIARNKDTAVRATSTGDIVGSPAYISPEQANGYEADARSDIYSLGCMMYECLTGRLPFEADTVLQAVIKRLHTNPAPFTAGGLELIVLRALQREPEKRQQTIAELQRELSGEVTPRRPGQSKRTRSILAAVSAAFLIAIPLWLIASGILLSDPVQRGNHHLAMARFLTRLGNNSLAKPQTQSAIASLEDAAQHASNLTRARELLDQAAAIATEFSIPDERLSTEYQSLGDRFVKAQHPAQAESAYVRSWQTKPGAMSDSGKSALADEVYAQADSYNGRDNVKAEMYGLRAIALLSTIAGNPRKPSPFDEQLWYKITSTAWIYTAQQRFEEAANFHRRAYDMHFVKTDGALDPAILMLEIGSLYSQAHQYEKAESALKRAAHDFIAAGDKCFEGATYARLAEVYSALDKKELARQYADKGFALLSANFTNYSWGTNFYLPVSFMCCARVYLHQGNTERALQIFGAGLNYLNLHGMASNGNILLYLDEYTEALKSSGTHAQELQAITAKSKAIRAKS